MRELRIIVGSLIKLLGIVAIVGSLLLGGWSVLESMEIGGGVTWGMVQTPVYLFFGGIFIIWCGMRIRGR